MYEGVTMKNIIIVCLFAFTLSSCASSNPLIIDAAGNGDITTVKRLHSTGQNINEKDYNGATPLMYAIWSDKLEVAKYLIEAGADLKAKDNNNYDALTYAIDYKQTDIINLLLNKGVAIESKDSYGRTPLYHAVSNVTDANVFKRIASAANNLTPRDEAFEIVKMLIKKGANVNAKDNESVSILEFALTML
jgi:ankyrin repeat protein